MSNCIEEIEALAKIRLDEGTYSYIAGAAGDESGLARNVSDLQTIQLVSRVLTGISKKEVDVGVTLLGRPYANPILIAPMGYQSMVHPDGEVEMARAVSQTQNVLVVPTLATQDLEKIGAVPGTHLWFQLYFMKDKGVTRYLVERAENIGCKAIVLTVDVPCRGARYRDAKSGFEISKDFLPKNFLPSEFSEKYKGLDLRQQIANLIQGDLSWKDVEWLRSICRVPVVLKGIQSSEDARLAVQNGISAAVVSNHGARQLDGLISPVTALPRIRDSVGADLQLLADGGVRSGTDVIRLLCLGADAVLIGRSALWGLAAKGAEGVRQVLRDIEDELRIGMTILGARSLAELECHVPGN